MVSNLPKSKFATRAIHAGQSPDPTTGAIMTPIYASSTFVQDSPGVHKGYEYARTGNPTRKAYEMCMANLEVGNSAYAFASGLAAADTVLSLLILETIFLLWMIYMVVREDYLIMLGREHPI